MTQKLKYLVLHCTATPEGRHLTKDDIIRMHTAPRHLGGRGWRRPGYSDMIYLDGRLVNLLPFDQNDQVCLWEISNGVRGLNGVSRHVVYVGGMDADYTKPQDTRTEGQKEALEIYVRYMLLRHPHLEILGHYQAPGSAKACPSFDVPEWLESIGIASKNIYRP